MSDAETPTLRGAALAERYAAVRAFTLSLTAPLEPEDMCVQTMPEVSPTKWHLAHTSWFFERFVLKGALAGYREHHPTYDYLFNSYYETVGPMHARTRRGHLSRPTVKDVLAYRAHVDDAMRELLVRGPADDVERLIELGVHHEQQHQELILTDILHVLAESPLAPVYRPVVDEGARALAPLRWLSHEGGVVEVGHGGDGFSFDNEGPRHKVYLEPFALASRPVTCGEYQAFIDDRGYSRAELWLSEGWDVVTREGWRAPLYWTDREAHGGSERPGGWRELTLSGLLPVDDDAPVSHLSYFEADAYARWAGARLPREAEWEVMSARASEGGGFVEEGRLRPRAPLADEGAAHMLGGVWEWTQSAYAPYPGFRPPGDEAHGGRPTFSALGEYNGKFMCNQLVLRGGSCLTPRTHARSTYRNFFRGPDRWQMTGLRLARDA